MPHLATKARISQDTDALRGRRRSGRRSWKNLAGEQRVTGHDLGCVSGDHPLLVGGNDVDHAHHSPAGASSLTPRVALVNMFRCARDDASQDEARGHRALIVSLVATIDGWRITGATCR